MAIDRKDPEVQALIEEVTAAATEALSAKNRELLGEIKTLRAKAKGAEIDPTEHAALQTRVEELTHELQQREKSTKAEIEKLSKAVSEKDSALTQYLIDAGLTDALAKAGVAPHYLNATKAMFKAQAALKSDGGKYLALLGEKPIADAIAEWVKTDEGKHFLSAPANSGGGATGGQAGGTKPAGDLAGTREQRIAAIEKLKPQTQ